MDIEATITCWLVLEPGRWEARVLVLVDGRPEDFLRVLDA